MINRGAVLLRYKTPALKWIVEADPGDENPDLSLDEVNRERTVYLIQDIDAEDSDALRSWVERNVQALFAHELESWYVDDNLWPSNIGIDLFDQWFEVQCHSVVVDTVAEPILVEDADAAPGPPDHLLN